MLHLKKIGFLVLTLGLFALSGCWLFDQEENLPDSWPLVLEAHWSLIGWGEPANPEQLIEGTSITLDLSGESNKPSGRISGNAGCNSYFASFDINGNQITITGIGSTKIYCQTPDGLMDQEFRYFEALAAAKRFQINLGHLEIEYAPGKFLFFIGALP